MKALKIIFRIFGFPFFFMVAVVSMLMSLINWIISYFQFGGEIIIYVEIMNPLTIEKMLNGLDHRIEPSEIRKQMQSMRYTKEQWQGLDKFSEVYARGWTFPLCAVWELKALHYQTIKK